MIRSLTIDFDGAKPGQWVLSPRPFDHWGQRFTRFDVSGVREVAEIGAQNSDCRSYLLRASGGAMQLRYEFKLGPQNDEAFAAPEWAWRVQSNRYTTAAPGLVELAGRLAQGATNQKAALRRIVEDAAGVFAYDHVDEPFNHQCSDVPMICGTSKGSCVDINTYILAAALSVGIEGQYIAGYWIHPQKTETRDMHCWLAFRVDGELVFWDLAHALKWGATLGARIEDGLNPAGGRRLAMSCGRGIEFDTPVGAVSISHFSEPVLLGDDGAQNRPEIMVKVHEPEGVRTQLDAGSASVAAE
ncbi:MAG: transglutaminase-like domain-containing protein [Neomegalonema sp.]|nr:transglutaminase-like domain-containing protein [Neomegalonema sp.]